MASGKARIEALKKRIAARDERNEADRVAADKLETDLAKKDAEKQRRADNHAKILLGAAVLLLPTAPLLRTMRMLCPVLTGRHRESLQEWSMKRGIDTTGPITEEPSVEERQSTSVNVPLAAPVDRVGAVLKKVVGKMDEGAFGLISAEILAGAEGAERSILENWFAELDQNRRASQKDAESEQDQDRQPSQHESGHDPSQDRQTSEQKLANDKDQHALQ